MCVTFNNSLQSIVIVCCFNQSSSFTFSSGFCSFLVTRFFGSFLKNYFIVRDFGYNNPKSVRFILYIEHYYPEVLTISLIKSHFLCDECSFFFNQHKVLIQNSLRFLRDGSYFCSSYTFSSNMPLAYWLNNFL